MEIETTAKEEEEQIIAHRLAVLNKCLIANEIVESKPIKSVIKQINETEPKFNIHCSFETEIFLTNMRIMLILYQKEGKQYDEKSIFYSSSVDFSIKDIQNHPGIWLITFRVEGNSNKISYVAKLTNQDQKFIIDFYDKKKKQLIEENDNTTTPAMPNAATAKESSSGPLQQQEDLIKKRILEREDKLKSLFELVVEKKKILTEEQFWQNHEGYQNFLKFRNRDEEKIRRDYIQNEIPLVSEKITEDISAEALDEKQTRFNEFREEIYDSESIIENQNLKSFQSYKQDIYFAGKIDALLQQIQQHSIGTTNAHQTNLETDQHDHHSTTGHNNHHLEIEEVTLITSDRPIVVNTVGEELTRKEYLARIQQNPSPDSQKKLSDFIAKARNAVAAGREAVKEGDVMTQGDLSYKTSLDTTSELFQQFKSNSAEEKKNAKEAFSGACSCIHKFSTTKENQLADEKLDKKQSEEYADKFYQLREILRWLYKEKNSAEKARPEIKEKLKTELEQIKNSLQDSNSLQQGIQGQLPTNGTQAKDNKTSIHDIRLKDLQRSFLFQ